MLGERPPLVSVVIPVYNGARFLKRSVGSALGQIVRDLEVIVIDDASTDAPEQVIQGMDARVRLIRQERNQGPAAAQPRDCCFKGKMGGVPGRR